MFDGTDGSTRATLPDGIRPLFLTKVISSCARSRGEAIEVVIAFTFTALPSLPASVEPTRASAGGFGKANVPVEGRSTA